MSAVPSQVAARRRVAVVGAGLLSLPVPTLLRDRGVNIDGLGAFGTTGFRNPNGRLRTRLPFNTKAAAKAGLPRWHDGMLRAAAIDRLRKVLPAEISHPRHAVTHFVETDGTVAAHVDHGSAWEADRLICAGGIRSQVAQQVFRETGLFPCDIAVCWVTLCKHPK